ncbi:MAG: PAS domain-containing sensor histidine kinase [Chloroflexota bacterium]
MIEERQEGRTRVQAGTHDWRAQALAQRRGPGVGLVLVVVAMVVKVAFTSAFDVQIAYLPLFAVLPIAVIIGGSWAGVTVSLVGAVVDLIVYQRPTATGSILRPDELARFLLFIPTSLWISWLIGSVVKLRGEAATQASRYSELISALPDFAAVVDHSSARITFANEAFSKLGWEPAQLVGRPIVELLPDIDEAIGATTPTGVVQALHASDGSTTEVDVLVRTLATPTGRSSYLVSARDVRAHVETEMRLTRLAAAERRIVQTLRAILGAMNEGVAVIGADGAIAFANDALTRVAGQPVGTRDDLVAALGTEIATGAVHIDDPSRWLSLWLHEVEGSELVIIRDTTEERERAQRQDAFIGVLSHELRTPITTILGLADLLSRPAGVQLATTSDLAADIVGEAGRLQALIEDLLVLSRMQVGDITSEPEPVHVRHAIESVVRAEASRYPHVSFAVHVAPNLPAADGDATLLNQVLGNLVGNAAKYSPSTGGEVVVLAEPADDHIRVNVTDNGPGFDPCDAERLFEIFFRSSRTASTRAGSGIGLYVAKTLVEAMHGRIWARTRAAGGSEFGFSIPILREDELAI